MIRIVAGLVVLFGTVFGLVYAAESHADPTIDQRCLNTAYAHMHGQECVAAVNPSDYN